MPSGRKDGKMNVDKMWVDSLEGSKHRDSARDEISKHFWNRASIWAFSSRLNTINMNVSMIF